MNPKKEIDQQQFENLCGLQCTRDEICDWFHCAEKTLNKWCKETYKDLETEDGRKILGFKDAFEQFKGKGKISLRRAQWQLAQKNATMAIFLGKQYLGQSDNPSQREENDNVVIIDNIGDGIECMS